MKLKPKFLNFNCIEGDKAYYRQAKAIVEHKPDIIIFEMPQGKNSPNTVFNNYSCDKKPIEKVYKIIKKLKIAAKKYPYALSDVAVWNNIEKLWAQGINTQIYNIDSPDKIRRECHLFKNGYPVVRKDWLFWVYLYLRDSFMTKNLKIILDNYSVKKNPTTLIFLQSIHWKHVQFLSTDPSKEKIWKYYFGRCKDLRPNKRIEGKITERSRVLASYWKKYQRFY